MTPLGGDGAKTVFTTPGQVVERKVLTGQVVVKAANVTFRDCLFLAGAVPLDRVVSSQSTGLLMEHCEIDGQGRTGAGVNYGNYTLRYVHVHSCSDGVGVANDVLIENSWIHNLARYNGQHPDCIQSTGGQRVRIRHNTLDSRSASGADLGNSCLQLGNENLSRYPDSVLRDYVVEDNWLDGGNYSINVRKDQGISDVTIRGNRFGRTARYGQLIAPAHVRFEDNVMDPDDAPLTTNRTT